MAVLNLAKMGADSRGPMTVVHEAPAALVSAFALCRKHKMDNSNIIHP